MSGRQRISNPFLKALGRDCSGLVNPAIERTRRFASDLEHLRLSDEHRRAQVDAILLLKANFYRFATWEDSDQGDTRVPRNYVSPVLGRGKKQDFLEKGVSERSGGSEAVVVRFAQDDAIEHPDAEDLRCRCQPVRALVPLWPRSSSQGPGNFYPLLQFFVVTGFSRIRMI